MSTPRWLQHPITVFVLPLVTLLSLPHLYNFLPGSTNPSYDETKLQAIATLIDDIYTVLANSTFIPHHAITRGPHKINKTALPCEPSPAVLRLMEILPYVNTSLIEEEDWIFGGSFMSYTQPSHLAELCDPLRGSGFGWTDYMSPSDIALTNWGTGGWNGDRTWVIVYNTEKNAIRIYEGEDWVSRYQAEREFGGEMEGFWFGEVGEYGMWDRRDSAPRVLQAIRDNYLKLKWTPWETSNKEDGFGVSPAHIRTLLKQNGWPSAFDHAQFNADFFRAKHQLSGKGAAEASN